MFAGAACDSVATITLDPLAGVTPPLFAYSGGGIERSRGQTRKASRLNKSMSKSIRQTNIGSNAHVTQKLRFRESPPRDK